MEVLEVLELMAKAKPPGTKTHTLFLPQELHQQIAAVAGYGAADDLIVECVAEAMRPRWEKWLKEQTDKLSRGGSGGGGQEAPGRYSARGAGKKSVRNR